jgi:hypothetical protein
VSPVVRQACCNTHKYRRSTWACIVHGMEPSIGRRDAGGDRPWPAAGNAPILGLLSERILPTNVARCSVYKRLLGVPSSLPYCGWTCGMRRRLHPAKSSRGVKFGILGRSKQPMARGFHTSEKFSIEW